MKVETYYSHGNVHFLIRAENKEDQTILGLVTSQEYQKGRILRMGGSSYECDLSAITSFNFCWEIDKRNTSSACASGGGGSWGSSGVFK